MYDKYELQDLLQAVWERLEYAPDETLRKLTDGEWNTLAGLLSRVAAAPQRQQMPGPDEFLQVSDRSVQCQGCPVGCRISWDEAGKHSGYSCPVGQKLAQTLTPILFA